jgi:hypothetical protein
MKLSSRLLASAAIVSAFACAPAAARAGTVSVEDVPGEINVSKLVFSADPGEQNLVTVSGGSETAAGIEMRVVDAGAPLTPASGCSGGGAPGTPAVCLLHPREAGVPTNSCVHSCVTLPGTGWGSYATRISLGGGNDSYDASAVTGLALPEEIEGGDGDDTITTGSSFNRIVPGPGDDNVHGGYWGDTVVADPTPDGNDVLDLGSESINVVDDSRRTEPLHLANHVLGAAGEEDRLSGLNEVLGGSGDDEFTSSGEILKGRAGNDILTGSVGKDEIYGGRGADTIEGKAGDDRLYGGDGDDLVEGGQGDDKIEEMEEIDASPGADGGALRTSRGNDRLSGGEGDDLVLAGPGKDTVFGGPGADQLFGQAGGDTIGGGAGDDAVAGETGADVLNGGGGDDELLAGRARAFSVEAPQRVPVDTSRDLVDCGPGGGTALANPWDVVKNCPARKTIRAVTLGKLERADANGAALVAYEVAGAGSLHLRGAGTRPAHFKIELDYDRKVSTGNLPVRATGATLRMLRQRGKATVALRLSWQPSEQPVATETRKLTLIAAKRG